MPLVALAVLVGAVLLAIALMPLSLVMRYRAGTARRPARGWVAALNLVGFGVSAALLLLGAAVTNLWVPNAFVFTLLGLAGGAVLGLLGLALSRWEQTPESLHYTPNRWLVLAVTLIVTARICWGFWRGWQAWRSSGPESWFAAFGPATSLAAAAVVIGYYLAYWAGLARRLRRSRLRQLMRSAGARAGLLLSLSLASAGAAAAAEPTGLLFGFAKRSITPELGKRPVYLAGFGQDRAATGVHDDLWARAFAVSDGRQKIAIVSVDLVGVFHDDVVKARERLQRSAPGAVLIVTSTHNHEGPDTMGLWGKGRFSSGVDRAYLERVRTAIADTAAEALGRLQPGRLVFARTRTPELIEDGRLPRVIDDVLFAMQVRALDGTTLGSVVNWSSHPEAIGSKNTLVSSDFPHWLRLRMEQKLGGTSVFIVGSIGGLMTPLGLKLADANGAQVPKDSFAFAQAVGERAADAALAALANARPLQSAALEHRRATVYVPLENSLFRLAAFVGVLDRTMYSGGKPATATFGDDLRTEIGYLRLGDIEALLVPAEIYPELVLGGIQEPPDPGADFKDAPREKTLYSFLKSEHKLVIGLANDEIGYVIPRRQWDAKAPFAYGRDKTQYGEVNSVGPSAAAKLAEAFERLLAR